MKKYLPIIVCGIILLSGAVKCPLYQVLGIPCPACGMTRAYKLFFTGKLRDAFIMHPLFLLPPLLLIKPFRKKWVFGAVITTFCIVYIVRMCVLFPKVAPMNYNYYSIIGEFLR